MEFVIIEDYYGNQRNIPTGGLPGAPTPPVPSPFIPLEGIRPDGGIAAARKFEV
jgi:hypothetical protein